MRADDRCPFCTEQEDCAHLLITCVRARSFWSSLNIDLASVADVESLWSINPFSEPNQRLMTTLLTCVCWNIWKGRNARFLEVKMRLISKLQQDVATTSYFGLIDVIQNLIRPKLLLGVTASL
ncbi:hypothetical protein HU200_019724 [Digitaria exilis]|uniref:Reverse transcriptase zinc-binding domain-containing protein n=1 Tax=Digitaria exilis TaxID=1010633 RepID=A0A835F2E5_9POAL|nr:hypothetical protein HU200_019724 [Digitaria exilis]